MNWESSINDDMTWKEEPPFKELVLRFVPSAGFDTALVSVVIDGQRDQGVLSVKLEQVCCDSPICGDRRLTVDFDTDAL